MTLSHEVLGVLGSSIEGRLGNGALANGVGRDASGDVRDWEVVGNSSTSGLLAVSLIIDKFVTEFNEQIQRHRIYRTTLTGFK